MPLFTVFQVHSGHADPRTPVELLDVPHIMVDRADGLIVHSSTLEVLLRDFRTALAVVHRARGDFKQLDVRVIELEIPEVMAAVDRTRRPGLFRAGVVTIMGRPLLLTPGQNWHSTSVAVLDVLDAVGDC